METKELLSLARKAIRKVASLSDESINSALNAVADELVTNTESIVSANQLDLEKLSPDDYRYDRLKLTPERIRAIADDMRNVAKLPSPRRTLEKRTLPNGLELCKEAVPFGVIGVIYEARPNVSADVFSLCLKSGNVCVLKGGRDADNSNRSIVAIIRSTLSKLGIIQDAVVLLPSTREAAAELMKARGIVDLIIPRGSKGLIDSVRASSLVPVIETGAGVCHCYVDKSADIEMAARIVDNSKTRRVSVCNALDCMLINRKLLEKIGDICAPLALKKVKIHADNEAYASLKESGYPADLLKEANVDTFGTEFLSMAMAVKTVGDTAEAIDHIDRYGSGHSESIVTENEADAKQFATGVDAACVYINAPTSFTDGAQFGLGAEIGISTQKLHARGPMALCELMTYKWVVRGNGQIRP